MTPYRHIIWDWNGTLIDDTWLCVDIINTLLTHYHKPTLSLDQKVGSEFMHIYRERWQECSLHQNAERVLEFFATKGACQSILSAADVSLLTACVRHFNLDHYFIQTIGLDNHYAAGKVEVAKRFIKTVHGDARHIVLIGDTTHDYIVSREIGIDCILFTGGSHPTNKLANCGVKLIENLIELTQIFR